MNYAKEMLEGLNFSEPAYFILSHLLWLLIAALLFIFSLKFLYRPRKSEYSRYQLIGKDFSWITVICVCALAIVVLAGPKISKGVKLSPAGNIDVSFLVDHSFSTKTDDIAGVSRLAIMQDVISKFVNSGSLQAGDRVTLFIFGTYSVWRMPLSEDMNDFKSKLAEIAHPKIYQEDSQLNTNLSNVLEHVSQSMDKQDDFFRRYGSKFNVSWFQNNRIVFLFSDGADTESENFSHGIKELKKRNIKVYVVGVGTAEGKKITIEAYNPDGSDKPLKKTIKTKLDMRYLNGIAAKTGGESYAVNSLAGIAGVQGFLKNAVSANRTVVPRLIASGKSQDIWWEILAIPSITLLLFAIKRG